MTKTRQSYGLQPIEQKLTDLLQPLFHGNKKEFALLSNLAKNWDKIVGKKYAYFCHPKSCNTSRKSNDGKLTIAVHNPAVGFFLESNSDLIIERLAVFCGYKLIHKIIIKQEPKELEGSKEQEIKLNQHQQEILEQNLKSVTNPELQAILKKIGTVILNETKS